MTTSTEAFSWNFGGWLSGQPAPVAWSVLGVAAAAGVVVTIWSYRSTLASLPLWRRASLCSLRLILWITLLVILAAPTHIQRVFEKSTIRPIAVLVDRSGSMLMPDNRQRRRLDDALIRWREIEPLARKTAGALKFYAFAEGFKTATAADDAVALPDSQTAFFSSLKRILDEAPAGGWGGIVTLTDGLDTTGKASTAEIETLAQAANAKRTPLFFLPGRNRSAGGVFFAIREFNAPAQTPPKSTFRVEAIFDTYQAQAETIEIQFSTDGVSRPPTALKLEAGRRLATWSTEVQVDKLGIVELEIHARDEIARTAVRVAPPTVSRILYFQGALDWSYRFLADILKRDSAFALTPVFNFPNPNALLPAGALAKMPSSEAELAGFDIVVLANASAAQFSSEQQATLVHWVREGGVLVFLTPDDDSTAGFSGSELEKMLPVVFLSAERTGLKAAASDLIARTRARTRSGEGRSDERPILVPYAWEDSPRVREIFAAVDAKDLALTTPVFSAYAHVARAKPGAEIIARHPDDTVPGTAEHSILLAIQRYGRGQSAVLTTDALWRWKLNQSSTARGAELFWQNLFSWLSRDRQRVLHFDHAPLHAVANREIELRIAGAGDGSITLNATNGDETERLVEHAADGTKRAFKWKPSRDGFWQIKALDTSGREARAWISVGKAALGGELSGMAPAEDLLKTLAERTGGSVLEKEPPPTWQETHATQELLAEHREPLWHRNWIFATLLAVYCVELLLRRRWHLL